MHSRDCKILRAYYAKSINVLAVLSFVGTANIGGGTVVYLRRDAMLKA